jgi:DDE superfamily endonuclease
VTLYVAAGISYNSKGIFKFYYDPDEPSIARPCRPAKPRKSSVQTAEEYAQVVVDWQASQPCHRLKVESGGNLMTQKFYKDNILLAYINHIKVLGQRLGHKIYFQEDNDPSHSTRSLNNVCIQLKRASQLNLLCHPAQSPDLNPIEGIWNIIKQRLKGGSWHTVAEFKAVIEKEWHQVTIAQIRRRISEMPKRCIQIQRLTSTRIKSKVW